MTARTLTALSQKYCVHYCRLFSLVISTVHIDSPVNDKPFYNITQWINSLMPILKITIHQQKLIMVIRCNTPCANTYQHRFFMSDTDQGVLMR